MTDCNGIPLVCVEGDQFIYFIPFLADHVHSQFRRRQDWIGTQLAPRNYKIPLITDDQQTP